MFLNPKEVALMTWWDDKRKVGDDEIAHLTGGTQWQRFDDKHKEFSVDPRNVRFGLSTDGINPFNERTSDHSTWTVILTMYPNVAMSEEKVPSHYSHSKSETTRH
jgi:hypothetical protein